MIFHNPINPRLRSNTDSSQYQKVVDPKNLVFSGGGIKGIAYCGAIKALSDLGLLEGVDRYAGSSAGAITAFLLAIGMKPDEIQKQMTSVDFSTFLQKSQVNIQKLARHPEELLNPITAIEFITGEINHKGLCDVSVFYKWLVSMLKLKKYNEDITFSDLYDKTKKELYVTLCNVNYAKTVIANRINTPKMPVALAVRASMSIPFVFRPLIWEGDTYVDGGTMYNYPIEVFDEISAPDKTVGFVLSTEEHVINPARKPDDNIIQHIERFFDSIMNVSYEYCFRLGNDIRTIFTDTSGVGTLDFSISDAQKKQLYDNGYHSTIEYFGDRDNTPQEFDHLLKSRSKGKKAIPVGSKT